MEKWNEYPLYGSYDVVVVGGGTAGYAAGATAARQGLKTLIVEELSYLGGTATGGGVGVFHGFAKNETDDTLTGIVAEMMQRMKARKGTKGIETIYCLGLKDMGVPAAEYNDDVLKLVIDEIIQDSGAEVLLHTKFIALVKEGNEIKELVICNSAGIQRVQSKVVMDASFHAFVANEAGVSYELGDPSGEIQPGTLMYKTANVDFDQYLKFPVAERQKLARQGQAEGKLRVNYLLARQLQNSAVYHNQSRVDVNPLDPADWTRAEMEGRKQIVDISQYWIDHVPGFQKAFLVSQSPSLGLRDSRRIKGKFIYTVEELMKGEEYPDTVVVSSYPVDVHHKDSSKDNTLVRPKKGIYYIPYRCMVTNEADNLTVIGRSVSADYEAHAAIRVTITCMRMGEAAALAAKESIESGIPMNAIDGCKIHDQLFAHKG